MWRMREQGLATRLVLTVLIAGLGIFGCAEATGVAYNVQGKVEGNAYISPDRSFKVQVPPRRHWGSTTYPWLGHGAIAADTVIDGRTSVSFNDDFCHRYRVEAWAEPLSDEGIGDWFDDVLVPRLAVDVSQPASISYRDLVDTRFGPAVYFYADLPEGAPCIYITIRSGITTKKREDGRLAAYLIRKGAYFYLISYAYGVSSVSTQGLGTPEENIAAFFEGFEPTPDQAR